DRPREDGQILGEGDADPARPQLVGGAIGRAVGALRERAQRAARRAARNRRGAASTLGVTNFLRAGGAVVASERAPAAAAVRALVVDGARVAVVAARSGRLWRGPAPRLLVADRIQALVVGRADERGPAMAELVRRIAGLLPIALVAVVAVVIAVR